MVFELFPEIAPWHVANFKYLADKGFYSDAKFTIYKPNYIIQVGPPSGRVNGPGYSLPPEFSSRNHSRGTLGMARRYDDLNPERRSNGSQFHILLSDAKHMDGSYTIFGALRRGDDVLANLRAGDSILQVIVYIRPYPPN
jgi:cyclophilin family peptidyl-prolyl cis-trans isomerase